MKNYIYLLKNISLFKNFTNEELKKLFSSELYNIKLYNKNTVIYFQNEKCLTLDIILEGNMIIQKIDSSGNVLTISEFTAGDIIGGNLIFSNKNFYPMTVVSKSDLNILHIEKQIILQLCQNNIDFLKRFLQLISDRTILLTDKIKAVTMKTIRQCIIEFLVFESYSQNSNIIKLNLSKKELAERFGVQRPSLSRELSKMRKDGLIEYNANSITIRNLDSLIKLKVHD